jgi:hypothetical protein
VVGGGQSFSFMAKTSQISGETCLFFRKNSPKFPFIFGEGVASYDEICVNLCGDRYLASVATVQKWPNKKNEKEKDWRWVGLTALFSSHRHRSSGACLNK